MTKLLTAIVLSIAIPAVANAAPAPAAKPDCCAKMKAEGKDCCKDMAKMDAAMPGMKDGAMSADHAMPMAPGTAAQPEHHN